MNGKGVIGGFEDSFEKGTGAVASVVKQTVKDFTSTTKGQITGSAGQSSIGPGSQAANHMGSSDHGTNEHSTSSSQHNTNQSQKSDQERVDFLRDLYGKKDSAKQNNDGSSNNSNTSKTNLVKEALGMSTDPNHGKTPEEIAKLAALRNQLHQRYYQELTTPKQKEISVTEKLEREEQMEQLEAFEKDKKKPNPLPATVRQGTGESVVGVSG